MTPVRALVRAIAVAMLVCVSLRGQIPEYHFYSDFRPWQRALPAEERASQETVLERYRAKLADEGVLEAEIARRLTLLRTKPQELENDFWNRFFTADKPTFNTEPNALLVSVVAGRTPGTALDVGMGEGRNALYLARLGWDVTGFDPADRAVGLAVQRARALKLPLRTEVALDADFEFGRDRWDLILYSWVIPTVSPGRLLSALRPGGIVVAQGARAWYPTNGLLRRFDAFHILLYEDAHRTSDFFQRSEMDIVNLVAEKDTR